VADSGGPPAHGRWSGGASPPLMLLVANLQFDSKACCVLTCVVVMYVMLNAVGPITGGELAMDTC